MADSKHSVTGSPRVRVWQIVLAALVIVGAGWLFFGTIQQDATPVTETLPLAAQGAFAQKYCQQVLLVRSAGTLRNLTEQMFGDATAVDLIVFATNALANFDPSFTKIRDDVPSSPGQRLCIPAFDAKQIDGAWSVVDSQTLKFEGIITKNTPTLLAQKLTPTIRTLVVNSLGGETEGGIPVGEKILAQGLDVVVDGACASTCANYFFAVAKTKTILPGAWVGWHGGQTTMLMSVPFKLDQTGVPSFLHGMFTSQFEPWAKREQALYAQAGLPLDLLTYSYYHAVLTDSDFWSPSPQTYAAFGITNVNAAWYPVSETALQEVGRAALPRPQRLSGGNVIADWQAKARVKIAQEKLAIAPPAK